MPKHHPFAARTLGLIALLLAWMAAAAPNTAWAQNLSTVTGKVTDAATGEPLVGVTVKVVDRFAGAYTDQDGKFSFEVDLTSPTTITFDYVGYGTVTQPLTSANTNLDIKLNPEGVIGNEVVVSASKTSETLLEAPVSIELLDLKGINQSPAINFYDALANMKSVDFTTSSMGLKTINTRGFNNSSNSRFVQRIDGMDNQAPGLNVPIGNIAGISDLDIASAELIPGAASALYGPNAFNGVLNMTTKNPWDYTGLSALVKGGLNHIDGKDTDISPYYEAAIRYAHNFNNKFAFKVNAQIFQGTDWYASDTTDFDLLTSAGQRGANNPARDAVNIYGDEISASLPIGPGGAPVRVSRTGYLEQDIVNYKVRSLKFDGSLNWRIRPNLELSYRGSYTNGTTVYHASNRYSISNFGYQMHKLELMGEDLFVRGYATIEDAGGSYDSRFAAINLNRLWKSDEQWFTDYATGYQQSGGDHTAARAFADQGRPAPGSAEFEALKDQVINTTGFTKGAQFNDQTKLYHVEGQYDFKRLVKFMDILVGANFRLYDLASNGTIFPDTVGNHITIAEYGGFVQLTKMFFEEKLRITASLRFDKNENFDPVLSPRAAITYRVAGEHYLRASYQTGFRMPTAQDQFLDLDIGPIRLIGGLPGLWDRYRIGQNVTYTLESVQLFGDSLSAFVNAGGGADAGVARYKGLLVQYTPQRIKPEQLQTFEIGYKGRIADRVFIDASYYYSIYRDFIGSVRMVTTNTPIEGNPENNTAPFDIALGNFSAYQFYTNATTTVMSHGFGIGVDYALPKGFVVGANYTYAKLFDIDKDDPIIPSFNTPEHKVNVKLANPSVWKNMGFNLNWRYVSSYFWQTSFAEGTIPAYHQLDAQVSYKVPKIKTVFKLGATNAYNFRHIEIYGGPTVGAMYYLQVMFDQLLH